MTNRKKALDLITRVVDKHPNMPIAAVLFAAFRQHAPEDPKRKHQAHLTDEELLTALSEYLTER